MYLANIEYVLFLHHTLRIKKSRVVVCFNVCNVTTQSKFDLVEAFFGTHQSFCHIEREIPRKTHDHNLFILRQKRQTINKITLI